MHIKTRCRPISHEHRSRVDLVRRREPPSYARSARWANWTEPGGVTWSMTWLRVLTLLILFGITIGGYAPAPYRAVPYDTSQPKLTPSDVAHLKLGGAITDMAGKMLIDPTVDDLVIVTMNGRGGLTTELRRRSVTEGMAEHVVGVVQPSRDADYAAVVGVMDLMRRREPPIDSLWVAAPD